MEISFEDLVKLILAVAAGGLIGIEREFRDKAAGFRTIILICSGATLFTIISLKIGHGQGDPARIAANIVTGIGFLGAGVILRNNGKIVGLTTASTIWIAAAMGMAIGGGFYLLSIVFCVLVTFILWAFPKLEMRIDDLQEVRRYTIKCTAGLEKLNDIENLFQKTGLRIRRLNMNKEPYAIRISWEAYGTFSKHERFVSALAADRSVEVLSF